MAAASMGILSVLPSDLLTYLSTFKGVACMLVILNKRLRCLLHTDKHSCRYTKAISGNEMANFLRYRASACETEDKVCINALVIGGDSTGMVLRGTVSMRVVEEGVREEEVVRNERGSRLEVVTSRCNRVYPSGEIYVVPKIWSEFIRWLSSLRGSLLPEQRVGMTILEWRVRDVEDRGIRVRYAGRQYVRLFRRALESTLSTTKVNINMLLGSVFEGREGLTCRYRRIAPSSISRADILPGHGPVAMSEYRILRSIHVLLNSLDNQLEGTKVDLNIVPYTIRNKSIAIHLNLCTFEFSMDVRGDPLPDREGPVTVRELREFLPKLASAVIPQDRRGVELLFCSMRSTHLRYWVLQDMGTGVMVVPATRALPTSLTNWKPINESPEWRREVIEPLEKLGDDTELVVSLGTWLRMRGSSSAYGRVIRDQLRRTGEGICDVDDLLGYGSVCVDDGEWAEELRRIVYGEGATVKEDVPAVGDDEPPARRLALLLIIAGIARSTPHEGPQGEHIFTAPDVSLAGCRHLGRAAFMVEAIPVDLEGVGNRALRRLL